MSAKVRIEQINRNVSRDGADFYPTPPWATRALIRHVAPLVGMTNTHSVWEPACGDGMMAEVLKEHFETVWATDLHAYGYGESGVNFITYGAPGVKWGLQNCQSTYVDWIITNPPYNLAHEFALRAFDDWNSGPMRVGCALLVRLSFLEGKARYEELFSKHPPMIIAPFVERIGFRPGTWDPEADRGVVAHAWYVWRRDTRAEPRVVWIPPRVRNELTRDDDAIRFGNRSADCTPQLFET